MPVPAAVVAAAKKAAAAKAKKAAAQKAGQDRRGPRLLVIGGVVAAAPAMFLIVLVVAMFGMGARPDAAGACPVGAPVPSSAEVAPSAIEAINALKPMYEQAGAEGDVAWSVLAAIDYRENNNDPNRSALSGEPIGATNPDSGAVTSSKLDSLQRAAEHVKAMASSVYGVTLSSASGGEDVKKAFLAYNRGYIYQRVDASPDLSPYVLNQYDAAHVDMRWPDIAGEPLAGQVEYGRYGAYTLFTRLGGATGSSCSAGISGDAADLLANPKVTLSASQRADLEAGLIDPRIIGVLSWIARDHTIVVTSLRSDHSVCAGGTSAETAGGGCSAGRSNHADGRGADIGLVDGEAVSPGSGATRAVVDAILAADGQLGLTELGQPFYDRSVGRLYVFTAGHGDHVHLGIDAE